MERYSLEPADAELSEIDVPIERNWEIEIKRGGPLLDGRVCKNTDIGWVHFSLPFIDEGEEVRYVFVSQGGRNGTMGLSQQDIHGGLESCNPPRIVAYGVASKNGINVLRVRPSYLEEAKRISERVMSFGPERVLEELFGTDVVVERRRELIPE